MKNSQICRHCGRYKSDHTRVSINPEEADKVLTGFEISLNDCLVAGFGFEPIEHKEPQPIIKKNRNFKKKPDLKK